MSRFARPLTASVFFIVVVVVGAGCLPKVTVGPDAQILCKSDAECAVGGLVCDVGAGLCVDKGATLDRAPPFLVDSSVDPPVVGHGETASVAFTVSEALAGAPVVTYDRGADEIAVDVVAGADADAWVAAVSPGDEDTSGPINLTATLTDPAGNTTVARIPVTLDFDLDAPQPVSVQAQVLADSASNPIFPGAPRAVNKSSGLVVDVFFDEPVKDAALDVKNAAGATAATAVNVLGDGNHAHFVVTGAVAPDAGDGALDLVVTCADLHQNAFDASVSALLAEPLVVDNTPPDPPAFTTFARKPWGSAEGGPATSGAGQASDALLLLLLPEGAGVVDGEVPLQVARAIPDAAGAFSFALPIDVPGLTAVAVDAAGNVSQPARPAVIDVTASVLDDTSPHRVVARPVARAALAQGGDAFVQEELRTGATTATASAFWRPLTPSASAAFPGSPIAAYDPVNDAVLVVARGETFLVDGPNVRHVDVPAIPVHDGAAMALDEARGVVVLFGGHGIDDNGTINALFEWDGERWTERLANDPGDGTRPAPRLGHAMAYAPGLGGVVVVNGCGQDFIGEGFGCIGFIPGGSDVWLWDGSSFTALCGPANAAAPSCGGGLFPFPLHPALGTDAAGRLVAVGGSLEPGPQIGFPVDTPVVAAFNGDHWDVECGANCAAFLPVNPNSFVLGGDLALIGACPGGAGGTCAVTYAQDVVTPVPLDDRAPALGGGFFEAPPVAQRPDGTVVEFRFDGLITTSFAGAAGTGTAPAPLRAPVSSSALLPRCGGAAAVNAAGDVVVAGGCDACGIDRDGHGLACNVTTAPAADVLRAGGGALSREAASAGDPLGQSFAAAVGGVVVVAGLTGDLAGVDPGSVGVGVSVWDGTAFSAVSTLFDPAFVALRPAGLVVDPADPTRALLFTQGDGASLDRVDGVDAAGNITSLCANGCGTASSLGGGYGSGGGATRALFFGGLAGISPTATASTLLGVKPATVDTSAGGDVPVGRSLAAVAVDDDRAVAFLFGGTATPPQFFGGDSFSCGFGAPPDCGDVWMFDGAAFTEVHPKDVLHAGFPAPRVSPAVAATRGGLVVVGGGVNAGIFNFSAVSDAWRLEASSTTAPAHLFEADLAAMGSDGAGVPEALAVLWCGAAEDAGGAPIDVAGDLRLDVWTARGFAPLTTAAGPGGVGVGACVRGTTPAGTLASSSVRGPQRTVIVQVRPALAPATGAGFASLTTTAFEVTAQFAP